MGRPYLLAIFCRSMMLLFEGFLITFAKFIAIGMKNGKITNTQDRYSVGNKPKAEYVRGKRAAARNINPVTITPFFFPYLTTKVLSPVLRSASKSPKAWIM